MEKVHLRHILLFFFKKDKNAVEAQREICDVYGEDSIKERMCQKWFGKFHNRNFNLNDAARSERSNKVDDDNIMSLIVYNNI